MHQLKNKKKFFEYWGNKKQLKYPRKFNAFYEEDVKLAVEYFKYLLDIHRKIIKTNYITPFDLNGLNGLINKIEEDFDRAFPDLCPAGDLIADKQNPQDDKQELKKLVHEFALRVAD